MKDRASEQHGRVARWQLLELGIGRSSIQRRLERGLLTSMLPGVYAVGHTSGGHLSRLMEAVLYAGPGALLCATSAGDLGGYAPTASPRIEVRSERRTRSRPGIVVHRGELLPERDRTLIENIPATSVGRTLLDLAATVDRLRLKRAIDEAERLRLFDLREVHDVLARNAGARGARRLRSLLAQIEDPQDTKPGLERQFEEFITREGLPRPATNALVAGFDVDAVWPEHRLVVELDSWEYHRSRGAFESDRARDEALLLAGYRTVRITSKRLRQRRELREALARLLTSWRG